MTAERPLWAQPANTVTQPLYDRISHLESRWRLQCIRLRASKGRVPIDRIQGETSPEGWTEYRIELPPELERQTELFRRFSRDPGFWQFAERALTPGRGSVSDRGKRYAEARQAYMEVILRLIVNGDLGPKDLDTSTRSRRQLLDLFEARSKGTGYYLLQNGLGMDTAPQWKDMRGERRIPFIARGPISTVESEEFRIALLRGDNGEPASMLGKSMSHIIHGKDPWTAPEFAAALMAFRNRACAFLESDPGLNRESASALAGLLAPQWWVLHVVYAIVTADSLLDWFVARSVEAQEAILAAEYPANWTPIRAKTAWNSATSIDGLADIIAVNWLQSAWQLSVRVEPPEFSSARVIWRTLLEADVVPVIKATAAWNILASYRRQGRTRKANLVQNDLLSIVLAAKDPHLTSLAGDSNHSTTVVNQSNIPALQEIRWGANGRKRDSRRGA